MSEDDREAGDGTPEDPTPAEIGAMGSDIPIEGDGNELPLVVGIGASAGGLEAATLLVQNLPSDLGAAYVLAQHMSPTHKSLLSTLIANETELTVVELDEDVTPAPNTIYVPRPNFDVVLEGGKIGLRTHVGNATKPKPSADRLFKCMAREMGERCVGLVLSGTGSDGSYGVQAIREAGGITIAQDLGTAKYDGMPASAVETGCIDLQLSPQQIGQHLAKILKTPRDLARFQRIEESVSPLSDLMHILLARTGVDFRDYRENTVNRRISRRMTALGIESYDDYVAHCRASAEEVDALHKDLLISVTRFFRDRDQFEQLGQALRNRCRTRAKGPFRVWIAGCATGEEAYSIAILLVEAIGGIEALQQAHVQIFATDIDSRALEVGRTGVYPQTAISDIPEEYVDRYFRLQEGKIEVIPALRQMVLFSHHNIFQDPPFINLDLVSLRNVMIYFKTPLQERVLARLHYALNSAGMLFLGTSEAIGAMEGYFETSKEGNKLFEKRQMSRHHLDRMGSGGALLGRGPAAQMAERPGLGARAPQNHPMPDNDMFEQLARSIAPNGFVVTRNNDIVRVFGNISDFAELSENSSLSLNTSILKRPLRDDASSLTPLALRSKTSRKGQWHPAEGRDFNEVRLDAYPILSPSGAEPHVLFAVRTRTNTGHTTAISNMNSDEQLAYIREIEVEMASTREALQQTVEELQTSNEELQSVNEELQSTNEELQATNEEMETSNEELQSTNEELITVNEEMQINATELQVITTELVAVLEAVPIPVLVIDHALQIRRASRQALDFFKLEGLTAVGVHLTQCSLSEGVPPLVPIVSEVFRQREAVQVRADTPGRLREIGVTPYNRRDGEILGVTLSVSELDTRSIDAMSSLLDDMAGFSHWRYDLQEGRLFWSPEIARIHGLTESDVPTTLEDALDFYIEGSRETMEAAIRELIEDGKPYSVEASIRRRDGQQVAVKADGIALRAPDGEILSIIGTFQQQSEPD